MSQVLTPPDREQPNIRSHLADDPITLFQTWFREGVDSGMKEPSAMSVATVDPSGFPAAGMMLLKGVDERGFVFSTNLGSAKAQALMHDPRVALCFYWPEIGKHVRVRGRANIVSNEEANSYFATRPRLSQISAWASKQSQPMRGYFELETQVAKTALHLVWERYRVRHSGRGFASCRNGSSFGNTNRFAVTNAWFTTLQLMVGPSSGCFREAR